MKSLVIGGTGTVGGEVVRLLKAMGHEVRVLTRSAANAGDLPEGVEAAVGDLADPESLRGPLAGVDGVFLATPVSPDETRLGLRRIKANKSSARFLYNSYFPLMEVALWNWDQRCVRGCWRPPAPSTVPGADDSWPGPLRHWA